MSEPSGLETGSFRLGVFGTLVWDRIIPASTSAPTVEEWGGISYALETLSAVMPEGWVIVPILKVGDDLADKARSYLSRIPRVALTLRTFAVPEENYRVELVYLDDHNRRETLTGTVSPWTWAELEPCLDRIDALYLNFITGLEMESDTAQALARGFSGPRYADLHSLFLGISPEGKRFQRELRDWRVWLTAFDAVQVNEDEFRLLGQSAGGARDLVAGAMADGLRLLTVTEGSRGASYIASQEFSPRPFDWRPAKAVQTVIDPGPGERVRIPSEVKSGDPTGCGDVWGATFFAGLLGGRPLEEAMADANRLAAVNLGHKGARGLRHHLLAARA